MEIDDVPKDIIAVYDVGEDTESITTFAATTVVETKDLEEDEVIKTEIADDDSFGNTHTEENYEPFALQSIVRSFSNEYLSALLKGNVKLNEFSHEMKDKIILALCSKLAVNRTT